MKTVEPSETKLQVPTDQAIIRLPLGLLGFERFKEYRWLQSPSEAPFCWLQAVQDITLTFLVVPPFEVLRTYEPNISDEDAAFLGLKGPEEALLYGIVTLRPHGQATVNLKGPIVLNRLTFQGKQAVLANASQYPLQYPLPTGQ